MNARSHIYKFCSISFKIYDDTIRTKISLQRIEFDEFSFHKYVQFVNDARKKQSKYEKKIP